MKLNNRINEILSHNHNSLFTGMDERYICIAQRYEDNTGVIKKPLKGLLSIRNPNIYHTFIEDDDRMIYNFYKWVCKNKKEWIVLSGFDIMESFKEKQRDIYDSIVNG